MTVKNEIKHRHIQALDRFFGRYFAMTPIWSNLAPERDCRQALKGKKLSPNHQEFLPRIEAKVGGLG